MRKSLVPAAVSCLLAICCIHPAAAQRPATQPTAPPPSGVLVAVIDVGYVFKQHEAFQQQMEKIRAQIQAFDTKHAELRKQLSQKGERLRELNPGSPEYRQLEAEMARELSGLQVEAQLKKKEVLNLEARAYFDAYNDVAAAVAAVANRYNIGLVLRFDRESIDPMDRNSVLRGVNRAVVYQNNIDISQLVLQQIQVASRQMSRPPADPPTQRR